MSNATPSLTEAAKMIRKELKATFPGTKFSVRSERFSGGTSIDVEWSLGPSDGAVRAIVEKYQDGSFDGMTDSYTYDSKAIGGAKYVQTRRELEAVRSECRAALAAKISFPAYELDRCVRDILEGVDLTNGFSGELILVDGRFRAVERKTQPAGTPVVAI